MFALTSSGRKRQAVLAGTVGAVDAAWGKQMARGSSHREDIGLGNKRTAPSDGSKPRDEAAAADKKSSKDQVSRALRSVYDDTLREDVPTEFRDLLNKLK